MSMRDSDTGSRQLRPMSAGRALLLKIWGPAESWDNPLMGTRYDPRIRQLRDHEQRVEREARRVKRRQTREEHRRARADEPSEHYTPDE
jgi:hypothetical protein